MKTIEQTLLPIEAGGLKLRNPFIVGSGPTTKTIEQLIEAERCGWAGASIKLAMNPPPYINLPPRYRWLAKEGMHMFTAESRLSMEQSLQLIDEARRRASDLILFANIAYAGPDGLEGWAAMARKFEQAGAHAIELNLCCPNMSFNVEHAAGLAGNLPASGASIGIHPEVVATIIDEAVCTGCGRCLSIGHCFAISMTDMEKARVDPAKCTACSTCLDLCEAGAIRMELNEIRKMEMDTA